MTNKIYARRREQLVTSLQAEGVGQVFIFDPANVFYYTGFHSEPHERFFAYYLNIETNETHLFVPALDKDAAEAATDVESIVSISDDEDPYDIVKQTISSNPVKLGIEGDILPYNRYVGLQTIFPEAQIKDVQSILADIRVLKTPDEIKKIQVAIDLIEQVLQEGVSKIQVGMTETALTAELEYLMRKVGADGPSFSTIVLAGEQAALPHGIPGERKIQTGDLLLIDFGVIKDGYCSDITRTFAIGEPTNRQQELYELVLKSVETGIKAAKAGVALKEVDFKARQVIEQAGYGEYFNNRIGHGLGIEVHEAPSVHGANETLVEKGMVFTIEPGIYIPGEIGIRIEEIIYINEQGEAEVLTSFPSQLQII